MTGAPDTTTTITNAAPRRRRVRERIGWTILLAVVTLSRLFVWIDTAIAEPESSTEQRQ